MAEAPDARLGAQAALELAPVLKFAGEAVRAVAVTERALERLGDADPELAERLEIEQFGSAYISIAARTLLAPRLAALGEPPPSPTTPFDRFRLAGIAFDAFAAGRPADEVADLATRALAHGALATDPTARRPRVRLRRDRAHVRGALRRGRPAVLGRARGRAPAGLGDRVRHRVEPALARRLPPRAALGGARGRVRRAGARRRGARLPGVPGRGAGHARLHRARPGHRGRRPGGLRRAVRARAGRRLAPVQPRHARPRLPARAPR